MGLGGVGRASEYLPDIRVYKVALDVVTGEVMTSLPTVDVE